MIEIENIGKSYGSKVVLSGISCKSTPGSVFALLGPNGSGKTTLIKAILGLTQPDSGYIRIKGLALEDYKKSEKTFIGYMPQSPLFPLNLKVAEILRFLTGIGGVEPIYQENLVSELGMGGFWNQSFAKLSLGMRQKVNILQCFQSDLDVYIIDEPTASLDPGMAFYLKRLIDSKKNSGKTIVFTSHIMSEVEELATDMLVLVEGKAVASGNPREFTESMNARNLEEAMITFWNRK